MDNNENCPKCGVSLQGEQIPEESRELFGGATRFKREIGYVFQGLYDGILCYGCPDCGAAWARSGMTERVGKSKMTELLLAISRNGKEG